MSKRNRRIVMNNEENPRVIGFKTPAEEEDAKKTAEPGNAEAKGGEKAMKQTLGQKWHGWCMKHPKASRRIKTGGKIVAGAALFIAGRMSAKPAKVEVNVKTGTVETEKPEEAAVEPNETETEE